MWTQWTLWYTVDSSVLDYDYFVIADQEEYENQEFLKEYFESNFLKSEEIKDIIIYDLRAADWRNLEIQNEFLDRKNK